MNLNYCKFNKLICISLICLSIFASCNLKNSQELAKANEKQTGISADSLRKKNVPINYYGKKTVILWFPTESEVDKFYSEVDEEVLHDTEDDESYYLTMAMSFVFEEADSRGFQELTDTNDYCGFILNKKDTIILYEKDFERLSLWKIILFDGLKHPKVISTIELQEAYNEYFNIKKEDDN